MHWILPNVAAEGWSAIAAVRADGCWCAAVAARACHGVSPAEHSRLWQLPGELERALGSTRSRSSGGHQGGDEVAGSTEVRATLGAQSVEAREDLFAALPGIG